MTGGTRGIGAAIAERYLNDGACVGIVARDESAGRAMCERLRDAGHRVAFAAADVGDFEACKRAVTQIQDAFGEIDTLINNAGISPKHEGRPRSIAQMEPAEWDRVVGINLSGAFYLTHLLAPAMQKRGFGRIVSMSSVAGKVSLPRVVGIHYSATKAALIGFTRHAAAELGPSGITVNAIAPGRIETPMVKTVSSAVNDEVVRETPLRRLGQPREVADLCVFLTSREADFVTGQVIDVAGGWLMT